MEYSTFAILALIILLVTNFNIIFSTKGIKYISALKELKVLIAIAVFDLNDLKIINDRFGHDTGDKYLKESVQLIKKYFPNVDIYRYGGDEFVVFLEGGCYNNRNKMLDEFNKQVESNFAIYEPIVACGLAEFDKDKDNSVRSVFGRADLNMYKRKELLKSLKGHYNN